MNRNTNNYFEENNFRPRARFDRLYYRPSIKTEIKFQPIDFKFKGLDKLHLFNVIVQIIGLFKSILTSNYIDFFFFFNVKYYFFKK
jgi:hypothetical protein